MQNFARRAYFTLADGSVILLKHKKPLFPINSSMNTINHFINQGNSRIFLAEYNFIEVIGVSLIDPLFSL